MIFSKTVGQRAERFFSGSMDFLAFLQYGNGEAVSEGLPVHEVG
jgi:hypothetical protein